MFGATSPGLILGYHGCDAGLVEAVLTGKQSLRPSVNAYDWLGSGVYFWDNSPSRAMEFARFLKDHPRRASSSIRNPGVIGAVIDLGFCLDLLDYQKLQVLKSAYQVLLEAYQGNHLALPQNRSVGSQGDLLLRELDCLVIQTLHRTRFRQGLPAFDSVRGIFFEGSPLYPNAGFREKDHIQICICNPNCIKGYFLPRKEDQQFDLV